MSQIDPAARTAMLVPDSTRDNYVSQIRRAAVARGIGLEAARGQQVKNWRTQHEADPRGGWNVLADWLQDADLGVGNEVSAADAAKVRALESAKRDPANPLNGILDMSDVEVRKEVDASLAASAEQASNLAPVITDDGSEVPAGRVDAVLAGDAKVDDVKTAQAPAAKKPDTSTSK
jgi:hypothetical protein